MIRAKYERLMHDMKQTDISRITGMHVTSISQIENGHLRPYPGQVEKMVSALNWHGDPAELFEEVTANGTAA